MSFAKKKQTLFFLILLVGISLLLYNYLQKNEMTITNSTGPIDESRIREKAQAEFQGAYPEAVTPTGKEVSVTLVAQESTINLLDGSETEVWTYNGSVPGPEIRAEVGDTVRVEFINNLPQETTIHWHGVRVPNAMDGVPGVTQEAVQPGQIFEYEFIPKDAGTFWFHPHVRSAEQVERGLYGTLIVTDSAQPEYASDTTLVIDDWRLLEDNQVDPRFVTPHDLMHDGRWGSYVSVNGKEMEELRFQPGSTHRLRFVNPSNGRVYKLDFGLLNAHGIAVDGMTAGELFDPQGFELSPGNRLDVLITVPTDISTDTFFIRDTYTRVSHLLARIDVVGSAVTQQEIMHNFAHVPDWSELNQLRPDHTYILDAQRVMGMGIEWTINGKAYPDIAPITLKQGELSIIRFKNNSARLHPMHMHGQFFKVLARNSVPVDEPFWRDTVLISRDETVDIALIPQDKGIWANHCHVLEHAEAGMMTVVQVE